MKPDEARQAITHGVRAESLTGSDVLGALTGSEEDLRPSRWPRVSRPCYDKARRCPGWAGGGMRYARVRRCDSGYLDHDRMLWQWRLSHCLKCGTWVLPSMIRWADPRWWSRKATYWKRDLADWRHENLSWWTPEGDWAAHATLAEALPRLPRLLARTVRCHWTRFRILHGRH